MGPGVRWSLLLVRQGKGDELSRGVRRPLDEFDVLVRHNDAVQHRATSVLSQDDRAREPLCVKHTSLRPAHELHAPRVKDPKNPVRVYGTRP